jgi:hypothetical protein
MPLDASHRIARLVAFYLPQFHPIPENDEWWGPGFTEWTNVAKAKPLFRGHRQPNLPADLGFYDLRLPEVRERQASLARAAGVESFCYWHYWFGNGKRILERPFNEVLASGQPDFPFCLAWANQSWSGIWHGAPKRILLKQHYPGPADEAAHFNAVLPALRDHRYTKVNGKPLFLLLDPYDHPDPGAFVRHWRALAQQAGLPGLYLVVMSNGGPDPRLNEFDAVTDYGPGNFLKTLPQGSLARNVRRFRRGDFGSRINALLKDRVVKPQRYKYADVVASAFSDALASDPRYLPTVLPNWDNTPRSGPRGVVFEGSTPDLFAAFTRKACALVQARAPEERIVFLKAWNEWAEGNQVEPDARFGHGYLDALRKVLLEAEAPAQR